MLLFDAKARVPRVVIAGVATLALSDALTFLAISSLESTPVRVAMVVLGGLPLVGMVVYAMCYVTRIDRAGDQALQIKTLLGQTQRVARSAIVRASYSTGDSLGGDSSVRAPWLTLRTRGRALPYVIDMQGVIADRSAFDAALAAR